MKILVHGGTHLGVVGCYGEKTYEVKSPDDLRQAIIDDPSLADYKLAEAEIDVYTGAEGHPIHTFIADEPCLAEGRATVFEYRIVEPEF